MTRLYVVDAGSLCGWLYFAHKDEDDGMLHAFDSWIWRFREQMRPTHMVMCFDAGHARRTAIDPEYKLGRKTKPKPEAFIDQLRRVPDVAASAAVPSVRISGEEADDVIASVVATHADRTVDEVIVCSTDKDMSALVCDGVSRYDPKYERFFDVAGVIEHMGIAPWRVADFLAMAGDSSDGIKGIKGIGKEYATAAIQQTKSMAELFRRAAAGTLENLKPKTQETIAAGREQFEHALKLTTLYRALPVPTDLDLFRVTDRTEAA